VAEWRGFAKARNIGIAEAHGDLSPFWTPMTSGIPQRSSGRATAMSDRTGDCQPAAVYTFSLTIDTTIVLSGVEAGLYLADTSSRATFAQPVGNGVQ